MREYVTEELELDEETLAKLKEMAEQYNTTIDNVVNEILIHYISEKITLKDFVKIVEEIDDNKKDIAELRKYYTIVDETGTGIARVIPL